MRTFTILAALVSTATAATISPRTEAKPLMTLRGGSFPPPKAGYHGLAAKGAAVSSVPVVPNLLSGALSGAYVSFGSVVALSIAGAIPGIAESNPGLQKMIFALLFPIALLNIVVTGTQLFTGNTASVAAAVYEGLAEPGALIRNWIVTYAGNLLGSLVFCSAFKYTGLLTGGTAKMAAGIATAKCKSAFLPQVVKGILANWLVCLGAYMGGSETELSGKILGIYIAISAFVMCGFEHSIANPLLLPLGIGAGAELSMMDAFVKNIIPVTIGNIIAGAVIYAGSYSFLYGKLGGHSKD